MKDDKKLIDELTCTLSAVTEALEQEKKKYNEALERARMLGYGKHFVPHGMTVKEYIFPELAESEDERIRKKLYNTVMGTPNDSTWFDGTSKEAMLAWLEKQKEQKPVMIQWTGNNLKEVIDFTGKSPKFGEWFKSWDEYEDYVHSHGNILKLFCENGNHYEVPVGAWIVKTPDGYNVASQSKFVQKSTESVNLEEIAKMIKNEAELFRNLLKKKGIDYQPEDVYWKDYARMFVSSAKKLFGEQKPTEFNIPKWKKASEELHAEGWKDNFFIKQSNTNLYRANDVHKGELYLKVSEVEELLENLPQLSNYIPKPAVWNEEDEKKIHFLVRLIELYIKDDKYCSGENNRMLSKQEIIEMLKSLRPSWKPSKEQMKALGASIVFHKNDPNADLLRSLYDDLQKIR